MMAARKQLPQHPTARKLLPAKVGSVVQTSESRFRRHVLYDNGILRSTVKDDKGKSWKGYTDNSHMHTDAEITGKIVQRALGHVRRGNIRLMPVSFQHNLDAEGKVTDVERFMPGNMQATRFDQVMKNATLAQKRACYMDLMKQLGYMHAYANVSHRDLSRDHGSNLFLLDGKHPHLLDFGIGKDLRGPDGELLASAIHSMVIDLDSAISLFYEPQSPNLKLEHRSALDRRDFEKGINRYLGIMRKSPLGRRLASSYLFGELEAKNAEIRMEIR